MRELSSPSRPLVLMWAVAMMALAAATVNSDPDPARAAHAATSPAPSPGAGLSRPPERHRPVVTSVSPTAGTWTSSRRLSWTLDDGDPMAHRPQTGYQVRMGPSNSNEPFVDTGKVSSGEHHAEVPVDAFEPGDDGWWRVRVRTHDGWSDWVTSDYHYTLNPPTPAQFEAALAGGAALLGVTPFEVDVLTVREYRLHVAGVDLIDFLVERRSDLDEAQVYVSEADASVWDSDRVTAALQAEEDAATTLAKFTDEARSVLGDPGPQWFAFTIGASYRSVDTTVQAAHPDAEWVGGAPTTRDARELDAVVRQRVRLATAVTAGALEPFATAATEIVGADDVLRGSFVPVAWVKASSQDATALAGRGDVVEVALAIPSGRQAGSAGCILPEGPGDWSTGLGQPILPRHAPLPNGFDASIIPWIGDSWGYREADGSMAQSAVWVGDLDGRGFRLVNAARTVAARPASAGRTVVIRREHGADRVVVIGPDGTERDLGINDAGFRFVIDRAGRNAYVTRSHRGRDARLSDVWRVPLDGAPPRRVLGSVGSPRALSVSPDGSAVAVEWWGGENGPYWVVAGVRGHRPVKLQPAGLVGFDARGRVVARTIRGLALVDPRSGRRTTVPIEPRFRSGVLTPSGRHLATLGEPLDDGTAQLLAVRDQRTGQTRTWDLPAEASWTLTDLTTDRYVVLARDDEDLSMTEWAIVDLKEGWLGFLPFCPPAAIAATVSRRP